jgi:hypothetical protein
VQKLTLLAYKLQLVQKITSKDRDSRKQFVLEMLPRIEKAET